MKYLLKIFFLFCILCGLYADDYADVVKLPPLKSITIEHIGDSNKPIDPIVINTHNNGSLTDYFWTLTYYIRVQEPFFLEIMELITRNKELFDENRLTNEHGSFQLYIENEDEGMEYYCYLNGREKSVIFFRQLDELVNTKHNYDTFKRVMRSLVSRLTRSMSKVNKPQATFCS
jgi:hypothetical protein